MTAIPATSADAAPEPVTFGQAFAYWLKLGFISFFAAECRRIQSGQVSGSTRRLLYTTQRQQDQRYHTQPCSRIEGRG